MRAVVVVAHGSSTGKSNQDFLEIISMLKKKSPHTCIEYAFLEAQERGIEPVIDLLALREFTEIKIIPYFLFKGFHLKTSIPQMVEACHEKYPHITVEVGEPLGVDIRLVDILIERIGF